MRVLQRLHPEPGETTAPEALALVRARERVPETRPFVICDMVTSLDGRAALDGRSKPLGSDADTELLVELRTLADAVLVGPETVRAEGYGDLAGAPARRERRRAAGLAARPLAVLPTRSGMVPWSAGLFAADAQPVVVYTRTPLSAPPHVAAPLTVHQLDAVTPGEVLAHLRAQHDVRVVLCEGGPSLLRALLAEALVDELFLTLTPVVSGDDAQPRIVMGGALPGGPRTLELRWVLRCGGELYLRYG